MRSFWRPAHRQVRMPEEVGAMTVFLCSDAAASITGIALPMGDGWTAQ